MYLVNIEYRQIRVNRDKFPIVCSIHKYLPIAVMPFQGLQEISASTKYIVISTSCTPQFYTQVPKHPIKLAPNSSSQLQFSFPLGLCLSAEFSAYQNSVALGHAVFDPGAISQSQ